MAAAASAAPSIVLAPPGPSPAVLYAEGLHYIEIEQSDDAIPYLLRAAECNHIEAALLYADMRRHKHWREADRWYQRVLQLAKGHSNEAALCGQAHHGRGLAAENLSVDEAMTHFRLGALLANPECLYQLGYYLEKGYGVASDVNAAYIWYRRAEAGGFLCAADNLGRPLPLFSSPTPACYSPMTLLWCARSVVLLVSPR